MEYFNKPLHTYTLNLSSQNGILLNKYWQRYHIKLYDFPGEKGKFLLPDISAILNLISVLENSCEVPASCETWNSVKLWNSETWSETWNSKWNSKLWNWKLKTQSETQNSETWNSKWNLKLEVKLETLNLKTLKLKTEYIKNGAIFW